MPMSPIRNVKIIHDTCHCRGLKTYSLLISETTLTHLLSATTLSIFGLVAQRATAVEGGCISLSRATAQTLSNPPD